MAVMILVTLLFLHVHTSLAVIVSSTVFVSGYLYVRGTIAFSKSHCRHIYNSMSGFLVLYSLVVCMSILLW